MLQTTDGKSSAAYLLFIVLIQHSYFEEALNVWTHVFNTWVHTWEMNLDQ